MKISVEKIHPDFESPEYKSRHAACFDLRFQTKNESVKCITDGNVETMSMILPNRTGGKHLIIMPGDRVLVPTGLKFRIQTKTPGAYSIRLYARSGMAFNNGLTLINGCGIVDSDYQKEVFVPLVNTTRGIATISLGDRIAQGELIKNVSVEFIQVDRVDNLSERDGGFGSTGVK